MTNIDEYADWVMSTWSSKGTTAQQLTFEDLYVMSVGLPGEVGEALEKLKKGVRDQHIPGHEFDLEGFKKEMGDAIYYWAMLLNYCGIEPSEVLAMNKFKSEDRKARGVEHGSGDNR
jgi:NTP pyrophosphatase (non-canonical NTP hydrolase)